VYVVYGAGSERIVFLLVEPTYFGATQVFESYMLCRIEDDASLTPVSEHGNIADGVAAAKLQVDVEDFDFCYGLYADGVRVASFAGGPIGYREWARRSGRLAEFHSLDDRYDHDIDELMA
jgi:hypothetical protein